MNYGVTLVQPLPTRLRDPIFPLIRNVSSKSWAPWSTLGLVHSLGLADD